VLRNTNAKRNDEGGDMITSYVKGNYPTRNMSLQKFRYDNPVIDTSVKIETSKAPVKNRIITASECGSRAL